MAKPPRQARRCRCIRSTDGQPCGNWAMNNSVVCHAHGGRAPQARDSQREQAVEARLERLIHKYETDPCSDPITALQSLAGRALAMERAIGEMVNGLSEIRYETIHGEQLRAEVAVLERAMDRCGKLLVDIAKLNIEERLAKVTEAQAALAQRALDAALAEMAFAPEQQAGTKASFARHLRAVS